MDHHTMVITVLRQPLVRSHAIGGDACAWRDESLNLIDKYSLATVLHLEVEAALGVAFIDAE